MGWFMPNHPGPSDPASAIAAWARLRRLMRLMIGAMLGTVIAAATLIFKHKAVGSARLTIALAVGLAFAMLLVSALLARALLAKSSSARQDTPEE